MKKGQSQNRRCRRARAESNVRAKTESDHLSDAKTDFLIKGGSKLEKRVSLMTSARTRKEERPWAFPIVHHQFSQSHIVSWNSGQFLVADPWRSRHVLAHPLESVDAGDCGRGKQSPFRGACIDIPRRDGKRWRRHGNRFPQDHNPCETHNRAPLTSIGIPLTKRERPKLRHHVT
jgi:hypothetical protein